MESCGCQSHLLTDLQLILTLDEISHQQLALLRRKRREKTSRMFLIACIDCGKRGGIASGAREGVLNLQSHVSRHQFGAFNTPIDNSIDSRLNNRVGGRVRGPTAQLSAKENPYTPSQ